MRFVGVLELTGDRFEMADQIGGRFLGVHAAVGEADQVGETVIAEDDGEIAVVRGEAVRTVEHVRFLDGAAFVPMEEVF